MRKLLALLALLGLAAFGGWRLVRALASDETRIRWVLEDAAEGFDETDTGAVLAALAPEFADDSTGLTRDDLRQLLPALFLREKDPVSKRFRFRVELPEERLEIQVAEDGTASASLEARFFESRGEDWEGVWTVGVEASLARTADGWQVTRSLHRTLAGDEPFF